MSCAPLEWLNAQLQTDDDLKPETVKRVGVVLSALTLAGSVPCTDAAIGPDGEVELYWDDGRHHFSLEIAPGAPPYWFYRDRKTEQYEGDDWASDSEPAPESVSHLSLFA